MAVSTRTTAGADVDPAGLGAATARTASRMSAWLVFVVLGGAIFVPGHLAGWLVERAFGAFAVCVSLAYLVRLSSTRQLPIVRLGRVFALGLALELVYLLATAVRTLSGATSFEWIEAFRYPAVAILIVTLSTAVPDAIDVVSRVFKAAVVYAAACTVVLVARVPIVTGLVERLYDDTKTTILPGTKIRVSIPFENPNYLAFFLVAALCHFVFVMRGGARVAYLTLCLPLLLVTGSRSGWLGAGIVSVILIATQVRDVLSLRRGVPFRAVVRLGAAAALLFVLSRIVDAFILDTDRVENLISAVRSGRLSVDPSAEARLQLLTSSWDAVRRSPLIGFGAATDGRTLAFDNQYASWAVRTGLAGVALWSMLLGHLLRRVWSATADAVRRFGLAVLGLTMVVILNAAVFLDNYRLLVVFICAVVSFADRVPSQRFARPAS